MSKVVMLEPNLKLQAALQKNIQVAKAKCPNLELEAVSCFIQDMGFRYIYIL